MENFNEMARKESEFTKRREALRLTQEDVAAALNVSVRTVANWDAGSRPSKKTAIEIDKYFDRIADERKGPGEKHEVQRVDRGFILELYLRQVLWQIAKDRADRAGEPKNWKKYLQDIDADTPEVMEDLMTRKGLLGNG